MTTGEQTGETEALACDGHDGEDVAPPAALALLDMTQSDSVDGVIALCGPCLVQFWRTWAEDPERDEWHVTPLSQPLGREGSR